MRSPFALLGLLALSALAGLATACGSSNPSKDGPDGASSDDAAGSGGDARVDGAIEAGGDGARGHDGGTSGGDGSSDGAAADVVHGDAHPDGSGSDGASSEAGVVCAGQPCFTGQSCVSGACAFESCTGYNVPGDYATLAAALAAVSPKGGTICLGAQDYDETVGIESGDASGVVVIQGVSAASTSVTSLSVESGDAIPSVVVKGLTLGSLYMFTGTVDVTMSVSISASKLESVNLSAGSGTVDLTLDGVEVTASSTAEPVMTLGTADDGVSATILIQNSYIHDSGGIQIGANFSWGDGLSISTTMLNNTFVNNSTAINDTSEACCGWSVTSAYYNNVFLDNTLALSLAALGSVGNNAFYGNTNNYGGAATDGSGTIKTDPKLDTSTTPPGLLAGSPLRGAADASHAPTHDYWGRSRGASVDIGAVQSSH
jgi:hypothetical protein